MGIYKESPVAEWSDLRKIPKRRPITLCSSRLDDSSRWVVCMLILHANALLNNRAQDSVKRIAGTMGDWMNKVHQTKKTTFDIFNQNRPHKFCHLAAPTSLTTSIPIPSNSCWVPSSAKQSTKCIFSIGAPIVARHLKNCTKAR